MKIVIGCENSDGIESLIKDLSRACLPEASEVRVVTALDSMDSLTWDASSSFAHRSEEFSGSMQIDTTHLTTETTSRAQKIADRLAQAFPQWKIQPVGRIGSPEWALIDEATKMGAELIVLGSKGHSLVNRLIFGSVSHSVVNHAHCSVRIARYTKTDHDHSGPVKILAGIDGSATANAALEAILKRKWSPGTEIRVVSSYDEDVLPLSAFDNRYSQKAIGEAIDESKSALQTSLKLAEDKLSAAGLTATSAFRTGSPRETLMKEVEDFNADTLFVGAKGHSLIDRLLIGSTSANLAAEAPCSVEIIR